MNWLQERQFRKRLIGSTVVNFDCRGCMASDHRLKYIGTVTGIEADPFNALSWSSHVWWARVKIVKYGSDGFDLRDRDLGETFELAEPSHLQEIGPRLFFAYS